MSEYDINQSAWNYCFRLQNVLSLTDQDYNASMCLLRGSWGVYDVVVQCIFLDEIREIVLRFMVRLHECCDCEIGIRGVEGVVAHSPPLFHKTILKPAILSRVVLE